MHDQHDQAQHATESFEFKASAFLRGRQAIVAGDFALVADQGDDASTEQLARERWSAARSLLTR